MSRASHVKRGKSGDGGACQPEGTAHANTIFMSSGQIRSDQCGWTIVRKGL